MGSEICELNNNTIHFEALQDMRGFNPIYLEDIDTLVFQPEHPLPAISVDCDGDLLLRVDPKTRAVVGIEIEDFEGYFVIKYPAFAPIWKQAKSTIKKNKCENEVVTTFLTIVQELLKELMDKQGCIKYRPSLLTSQPTLL